VETTTPSATVVPPPATTTPTAPAPDPATETPEPVASGEVGGTAVPSEEQSAEEPAPGGPVVEP
jgi:hypothetical protein